MKDAAGVTFIVGDKVAYPVRTGSSMWLEFGEVVKVNKNSLKLVKDNERHVVVKRTDRVVVLNAI
jgi:hypothetical protein